MQRPTLTTNITLTLDRLVVAVDLWYTVSRER